MSVHVLIVEDDREIRNLLVSSLRVEGFEVSTAVTVHEAITMVEHSSPDVILLDLGLPDADGAELVKIVRRQSALPIIVVSARHEEEQRIQLLDLGADDYLTKPFSVAELQARIRVAMRHRGTALSAAVTAYDVDDLHVDLTTHRITRSGETIHLTPTEFKLLARLVRSAGRVVTHRQLLLDVWGGEFVEHTHYLRLYMGQLRAKIEKMPAQPRYLLTETGIGYRLADI
jgi:two-component system, OmpR family, KDP operon response regulator KdpE